MNPFSILMFIFGILIILVGFLVYRGHDEFLARGYYKKESKSYLKFVGKTTMLVGLSPILSGIVALFIDNVLLIVLTLIISFVLSFIISVKLFRKS